MEGYKTTFPTPHVSLLPPVLPQVLGLLCHQIEADRLSPEETADLVATEPSLLVQTLRAAPADLSPQASIRDHLHGSIERLGRTGLEQLLSATLSRHLEVYLDRGLLAQLNRQWLRALGTAFSAQQLARRFDEAQADLAYFCGLLSGLRSAPLETGNRNHPAADADLGSVTRASHSHDGSAEPGRRVLVAPVSRLVADIAPLRLAADLLADAERPLADLEHALPITKWIAVAGSLSSDVGVEQRSLVGGLLARYSGLEAGALADAQSAAAMAVAQVRERFRLGGQDAPGTARPGVGEALPSALVRYLGRRLEAGSQVLAPPVAGAADSEAAWARVAQLLRIRHQVAPLVIWRLSGEGSTQILECSFSSIEPARQILLRRLPLSPAHAPGRAWLERAAVHLGVHTAAGASLADRQLLEAFGTAGAVCLGLDRPNAGHVLMAGLPHASVGADQGELVAQIGRIMTPLVEACASDAARAAVQGPEALEVSPANELDRLLLRKTVHEIRTPLSVMKNYLGVLKLKIPEADPVSSELAILGEEIDRVSGLLRDLTESAQDEPLQWVSVNAIVTDMLAVIGKRGPAEALVEIRTDLDADLPVIFSRRNRIKQVVLNLLKNAFEAQPNGGVVEVATRVSESAGPDSIRLIVRDRGPGLSEAVRARLFEPGNTSKSDRGHGLGLHIVRTAIAALGGHIGVSSRAGQGAEFVVELPIAGESAPGREEACSPQPGATETGDAENGLGAAAFDGDSNWT